MASDPKDSLEGSLETIKEILVGQHAREIQQKVVQLQEHVDRNLGDLQKDLEHRIDSLDASIRRELTVLRDDLRSEHDDRIVNFEKSAQAATASFREVRDQLVRQYRTLSEDIQRRHRVLYMELEKTAQNLDARKTDRQLISTLMKRMAEAIQGETPEPAREATKIAELPVKEKKKSA